MASGTIEAYIRRFREQPPAPPEKRYVPNDVDFWWQKNNFSDEKKQGVMGRSSESTKRGERYSRHVEERGYFDEDHDGEEDISENNHYDDADTLNRSQNTQLTDENYGDEDDNDDDDGDGELDDFEKRSESLMKKCDNLLSNIDPSETIQNMEPTSRPPPPPPIPPLLPNGNKMMESEEFAPWVSVDVPNSLTNPSDGNPYDTLLSPIKSTSPPTVDDRISPDSIDPLNNHDQHHQQEQHSHDYDEISEESNKNNDEHDDHLPDTESDSDSDISDLEETSVETTDELIKRAERLLNGYSIGEQLQQQSQHSQQQSTLSISSQETANLENSLNSLDHLPLPTPSADIPIPEIPPTRLLTPITEISSTQQQSQQSISPTPLQFKTNVTEIGVQTDFQSIDPPLNSSIMSSTTTLFISPVSTPRHSPLEMPSFSDDKNSTHQQQPQQTQEGGALNKASFPSSLHPPFVVETSQHQQSNSFPTNTPAPLPPLSMEGFSNMSYEEIEPYLSDEIISTLWNRLVIVREQMNSPCSVFSMSFAIHRVRSGSSTGQWSDSLFNCFSQLYPSCLMSFVCPCVILGQVAEAVQCAPCSCICSCYGLLILLFFIFLSINAYVIWFMWGLAATIIYIVRLNVRKSTFIAESPLNDMTISCCCPSCAIAQMARHVYRYRSTFDEWTCAGDGRPSYGRVVPVNSSTPVIVASQSNHVQFIQPQSYAYPTTSHFPQYSQQQPPQQPFLFSPPPPSQYQYHVPQQQQQHQQQQQYPPPQQSYGYSVPQHYPQQQPQQQQQQQPYNNQSYQYDQQGNYIPIAVAVVV